MAHLVIRSRMMMVDEMRMLLNILSGIDEMGKLCFRQESTGQEDKG